MEREEKIRAIMNRDGSYDGKFCYDAKSIGIVCKPLCEAENPFGSNITSFDTIEQATNAGYRPCKVCMNSPSIIQMQHYHPPRGDLVLGSFDDKLYLYDWAVERHRGVVDIGLRRVLRAGYEEKTSDIIRETSKQLDECFDGKHTISDIPMLLAGIDFRKKIWHKLLEIPYGVTISYGELATQLGMSRAIQVVANANGANAISIIIPYHHVIGNDHSLTGYDGRLATRKKLLELKSAEKTLF